MYREAYHLHNLSIPYYAGDYRSEPSVVWIFRDVRDLGNNVWGHIITAISDQIGASIHDRVHFRPALFINNGSVVISSFYPNSFFISQETLPSSEEEDYTPQFDPPLGAPQDFSFVCEGELYYNIELLSINYN